MTRALEALRQCYEKTGHPRAAWLAFWHCRTCGAALPPWVVRYLDEAAAQVLGFDDPDNPWREHFPEPRFKFELKGADAESRNRHMTSTCAT